MKTPLLCGSLSALLLRLLLGRALGLGLRLRLGFGFCFARSIVIFALWRLASGRQQLIEMLFGKQLHAPCLQHKQQSFGIEKLQLGVPAAWWDRDFKFIIQHHKQNLVFLRDTRFCLRIEWSWSNPFAEEARVSGCFLCFLQLGLEPWKGKTYSTWTLRMKGGRVEKSKGVQTKEPVGLPLRLQHVLALGQLQERIFHLCEDATDIIHKPWYGHTIIYHAWWFTSKTWLKKKLGTSSCFCRAVCSPPSPSRWLIHAVAWEAFLCRLSTKRSKFSFASASKDPTGGFGAVPSAAGPAAGKAMSSLSATADASGISVSAIASAWRTASRSRFRTDTVCSVSTKYSNKFASYLNFRVSTVGNRMQ